MLGIVIHSAVGNVAVFLLSIADNSIANLQFQGLQFDSEIVLLFVWVLQDNKM